MNKAHKPITITISFERCKGCEYCCSVCPKQLLRLSDDYNSQGHHYAAIENAEECSGCRFCAIMCPEIAIELIAD